MANPKYRLTLAFPGGDSEAQEAVLAAEDLLREDLCTGVVAGHEFRETGGRLFLITACPERCFDDAARRLRWLDLTPATASIEALEESKVGDFHAVGQAEPLPRGPDRRT